MPVHQSTYYSYILFLGISLCLILVLHTFCLGRCRAAFCICVDTVIVMQQMWMCLDKRVSDSYIFRHFIVSDTELTALDLSKFMDLGSVTPEAILIVKQRLSHIVPNHNTARLFLLMF